MKTNKPFAEVIDSSLQGWLAQSWQWNQFPTFGSLVSIETKKRTLFAVVHQVQTGSMEPMRYPFPYQKTQEELMKEQPQIFEFLKTTFSCLTLGYQEKESMYYLTAPEPPPIHAFVHPIDPELARQFFCNPAYLHVIFSNANQLSNLDELLLALLKHQKDVELFSEKKINSFINAYSLLTGNDYRRLKLFLQRVQQIVQE